MNGRQEHEIIGASLDARCGINQVAEQSKSPYEPPPPCPPSRGDEASQPSGNQSRERRFLTLYTHPVVASATTTQASANGASPQVPAAKQLERAKAKKNVTKTD